jgi:hypothetical protein
MEARLIAVGAALLALLIAPYALRWWATRHVVRIYFGGGRRTTVQHYAEVIRSETMQRCAECAGTGYFSSYHGTRCPKCRGLGWVE